MWDGVARARQSRPSESEYLGENGVSKEKRRTQTNEDGTLFL